MDDYGPLILGAVALAFLALVVMAIRRMSAQKRARAEDQSPDDEPDLEREAAEQSDEDEEGEGEDEDEQRAPVQAATSAPTEGYATLPDSPAARAAARKAVRAAATKEPAAEERPPRDRAEEKKRLAAGLAKTRGGFIARLGSLFRGRAEIDPALLEQVEEVLFTADIGVATSHELIEDIRKELGKQELKRPQAIWAHIRQRSAEILAQTSGALDVGRAKPFVILIVGVNGTGKTTTIGKLAARLKEEGRQVVLAAGDTFRAAAVEQLEVWGERAGCPVVKGKEGADPTSVVVDALKRAQESGADVVLADTAGRLHTKVDLMEEIQKVRRSISKRLPGAPHETFLVLDATTGQNAIAQAKMFKETVEVTGLILTKLDGTAKGGVVLGICNELKLPVRFIGIGERSEDLREFDAEAFIDALYEDAAEGS
jgi:fused signal recognition particle receptor